MYEETGATAKPRVIENVVGLAGSDQCKILEYETRIVERDEKPASLEDLYGTEATDAL